MKSIKGILVGLNPIRVHLLGFWPNLRYHIIGMLILGGLNSRAIVYYIIHDLAELGHVVFYVVDTGFHFLHLGGVQGDRGNHFWLDLTHLLLGRPESRGNGLQSARAVVALLVIMVVSGLHY